MHCEEDVSTFNLSLVFTNQVDGTTRELITTVPFFPGTRELRINEALDDTCQRVMPLQGAQLFHVDFANRINRLLGVYPFQTEVRISYEGVFNGCVQLKVMPNQMMNSAHSGQMEQQKDPIIRTKKVKERTIEEALEAVKWWRRLYQTDDGSNKRLYTLEQAAQKVGIAKKTLDDYYSIIRVAINHNFNFEGLKDKKIGILRKFVRIAKEEGEEGVQFKMSQYVCDMEFNKFWAEQYI